MKKRISTLGMSTMDNGKIRSGKPFLSPSLIIGLTLSFTMVLVAALSLSGCKSSCASKPGTGNLINDSRSVEEVGLTNASRSMEELGRRVIQGINNQDKAALAALALSKEEYRRYIFPALPIGKVEAWQREFDFVWGTVHDRSSYRLMSILQHLGGHQLEYIGMRVAGESVTNDLGCIVHKDVRIRWKDSSGTEKEAELFAGMVELHNQYKIESFDVDTL
jgi:hypothetical protein